jgi:hypothetical protein
LTTRATTTDPPFAAFAALLADAISTASAPAGMHALLASDPIRPIPVKTVKVQLLPTFGTAAREQIEIPEAPGDAPSAPQSTAPPQALFKPQNPLLPQKTDMLGGLLSREQPVRDDDIAPPLSTRPPQSAPRQAEPSGAAVHSGWSIQLFWTVIAKYKELCAVC